MQNHSLNPTLRAVLAQRQGKGFSEVEATNMLRQLIPQIDYLHQKNQAHGQISLDTIIQNNQQIILTATPTPQPANQINIQQDIYALGIVIIELLTGKVANSLRNADGSWNWQDDCFVSDQFTDIINQMIGNSAQGLFKSISEIIAALGLSTPAQPVISAPVNQVFNSQSKNKIQPWKFGLIAAGATILVGLAGFGVWNLVSPMLSSSLTTSVSKKEYEGLFPVKQNSKIGFMDKDGKLVIQPQFDFSYKFSEGLATVGIGNKYGYIDKNGKIAINLEFDGVNDFNEGLASIRIGDKWGCINKRGKIVIAPQFDFLSKFSEDLASVRIGDKRGYINKNGKIVINPQFDGAEDFHEGLARVKVGDKIGYIDKIGKIVISVKFSSASNFNEGLATVRIDDKVGYIDKTGKILISPQVDVGFEFNEGLAKVKIADNYAFIDKSGKIVITPQFGKMSILGDFHEGLAKIGISNNNTYKWGYIDKTGKIVIAPQFDDAYPFNEDLAFVKIGEKFGYIDKNGKYVWQPSN